MRTLIALLALALSSTVQAETVYLPSPQGAERFRRAASEPEALALFSYVETEARLTFCGPAALAAALNSIGTRGPTPVAMFPYQLLTQDTLFTPENQAVKSYAAVERAGMTLAELARFAANFQAVTEIIHASDIAPDGMRRRLQAALGRPGMRVLLNYSRKAVGQDGDGHISPLAAYDADSDSFLVLDVARYKYPPVWISFEQLFAAMQGIDSDSGRSRGVLILWNPSRVTQ